MNRAQQITHSLTEMYYHLYSRFTPTHSSLHKATHSLVHQDATQAAKQHSEKLRLALKDKGLPKTHIDRITGRAARDTYMKHYRKTYHSTMRAIEKDMKNNSE